MQSNLPSSSQNNSTDSSRTSRPNGTAYGYGYSSNVAESLLMTPAEVAELFKVSPKTVARWSRSGRLSAMRTVGGHRRFHRQEVNALRSELDPHHYGDDQRIDVDERRAVNS